MDDPALLRAAKLIAVPIPFALAGYSLSSSQNCVSYLFDQPADVSTPTFAKVFYGGATLVVPISLVTTAATAFLAYIEPDHRRSWGAALGCMVAFSLWTPLVMMKGISRLIAISESREKQEKATANLEARQLLVRWVKENYVRSALLALSGAAALSATFA